MTEGCDKGPSRAPWWVWALILCLAAITPAQHAWVAHFPTQGTAFTGLHVSDDVVFLHCMRMFDTGFYTPFASADAPLGNHSPRYFAAPFFWVYGVLGWLGQLLHVDEFMWLGVLNGLSVAVYLLAAFLFLRTLSPRLAPIAFLLFALGFSPAGLLYVLSALFGVLDAPQFDAYFRRFTLTLLEGNPNLMAPRLYYTVPLALGVFGLTLVLRGHTKRPALWCGLLFFVATLVNARLVPMFAAIGLCAAAYAERFDSRQRRGLAMAAVCGPLAGGLATAWAFSQSPTFASNALGGVRDALPFSAYLADILLAAPLAALAVWRGLDRLSRTGRVLGFAALGYLAAFAVGFSIYQTYQGNWLAGRDYRVAVAVSDWAFLGALAGAVWGWRRRERADAPAQEAPGWISLWYLLFFAASISAFGAGWFMRFAPSRLLVLMGIPFCLLAADGLARLRGKGLRGVWLGVLLLCGAASTGVSALCFLGPLGLEPGRSAFSWMHAEAMTTVDARVLNSLGPGRVLTADLPGPYFADIISLRPGKRSMLGMGMLNFSDVAPLAVIEDMYRFFRPGTDDAFRQTFIARWKIDYVFCSDTHEEDDAVAAELRSATWLQIVAEDGGAVLFRVNSEAQ